MRIEFLYGVLVFSVLGGVVSFVFVFCVNNVYACWWEVCQYWGFFVNYLCNLVVFGCMLWWLDDELGWWCLVGLIGDFVVGLLFHFCGELILVELLILSDVEWEEVGVCEYLFFFVS